MAFQDKVYLSAADFVSDSSFVCGFNFPNVYHLTGFGTFLEWAKNCRFFRNCKVPSISVIMVSHDCFETSVPVLGD